MHPGDRLWSYSRCQTAPPRLARRRAATFLRPWARLCRPGFQCHSFDFAM